MVVYMDIVWLLNFIVDGMLILLTAFILKRKWKWYRVCLGALLGSSMVLFAVSSISEIMNDPLIKILFSIGMILVSFGFIKGILFIKTLLVFYFSTFMVGGGIVGLHYLFQSSVMYTNGVLITMSNGFGDPISWIFVCVCLPVIIYFSKKQVEEVEVRKIHFDELVNVEIKIDNKIMIIRGLIDSGNSLCDPLTQVPIMIVDITKVRQLIPQWIYEKSKSVEVLSFSKREQELSCFSRIRLVPYQVVGKSHQLLIALKPDYIKIIRPNCEERVVKAFIGLSHTTLSSESDFDCLLHPKMLLTTSMFSA